METVNFTGDNPQPRFGHTICQVAPQKIVLYGGAVGDTGKYNITGDVFVGDLLTRRWKRVEAIGIAPTNRAAHCALQIEFNQMIIFGGAIGGGGLADDNLYVFDVKNGDENANWVLVPVIGTTPGRRYGHTMVLIKPYLIIHGGNTGTEPVNDVWSLNLEKSPYSWSKLECASESPCVRVYHSSALCITGSANGMMVIFGGRTADQTALNDTWGLRRHRDGRWDWVRAPYKNAGDYPAQRYQHSTIFIGTLMLVVGGRSNQVGETLPFEVYDTETSDWFKFPAIQRFRHSTWMTEQFLFLHGGFDSDTPNIPTEGILKMDLSKRLSSHPQLLKQLTITIGKDPINMTTNLQQSFAGKVQPLIAPKPQTTQNQMETEYRKTMGQQPNRQINSAGSQNRINSANNNKNIRLANQAVVAITYGPEEDVSNMVKKVSIDKLQEEHKKLGVGFSDPNYNSKAQYIENICLPFINNLLLPKDYQSIPPNSNLLQGIKKEFILKLCDEVQRILEREPIVLRLRAPIKIFGSLMGQYIDLMRFFDHFKAPYDNLFNGDIDSYDYLFLGGYVDRGSRSLETILLLFALKLKNPDQIHLLRGLHEDRKINKIFGFADECYSKFQEDIMDSNSVYQRINKVFEYMPLAALIEDKILCVHGGIGTTIRTIDEIELIQRPLEISHEPKTVNYIHYYQYQQKIALELLWSDPVIFDEETENSINVERDIFNTKQVMRFGTNRSNKFMQENNLNMIVRTHEPVNDGFDKTANNIITIFSASDYVGNQGNQGGMLTIRKNNQIIPKIINPANTIQGEQRWLDLEEAPQRKKNFAKYVLIDNEEIAYRKRPPTPLRKKKVQQSIKK